MQPLSGRKSDLSPDLLKHYPIYIIMSRSSNPSRRNTLAGSLIGSHGSISEARRYLKAENLKYGFVPKIVPPSAWPDKAKRLDDESTPRRFAVWRSRDYLIQGFYEKDGVIRLSVIRTDIDPKTGHWKDGISWDELQRLKRLVGYGDREAVEIYPRDKDVVYDANVRHLWILPEPLPFSWKSDEASRT